MAAQDYQIIMRSGPTPGKVFPIEQEEFLLGRDLGNEIAISDPEVSRRHARFYTRDNNIIIEDLGSTNGTFLNGERISSPQQLRPGDAITLGESIVLVFEKAGFDPNATVVAPRGEPTVQRSPEPQPYQVVEPAPFQEPQPAPYMPAARPPAPMPKEAPRAKKRGFPVWLIILLLAIVVVACVIAVTLYFMPASWWCAITFNMLPGCPVP